MKSLSERAFAKINLSLDIVGRRSDGYHELRSVMQTISLYDDVTVTISDGDGITIECSEPGVPLDERNTCYKAAKRFLAAAALGSFNVTICIKKRIPSMAGLGGGSSDAAAVLRMMNRIFDFPLSREALNEIAAKVGADVPFLIEGNTALCEGIGERLTPLKPLKKLYLLLIKPEIGISTPEAYKAFDLGGFSSANSSEKLIEAINSGIDISPFLGNDLQRAVSCPEIEAIGKLILENGANASLMTGSGSCVYGLFDDMESCEKARKNLSSGFGFAAVCETV